MICKKCDELLALYERSVRLYTNAVHDITGALGDDFTRAFANAESLKQACQAASENLMIHWKQKHGHLAKSTEG